MVLTLFLAQKRWTCLCQERKFDTNEQPIETCGSEGNFDSAGPGRIVILKLGGSSITDKARFETLNNTMLQWMANTVAQERIKQQSTKFIIVHGAGSFGHYTAKQYGLKGHNSSAEVTSNQQTCQLDKRTEGMSKTRRSVTKLNWEVVNILLDHKIPAVGLSPFSMGLQAYNAESPALETNAPIRTLIQVVYDTIQRNIIPVLHGDAVFHGTKDSGILSGDTIVSLLARYLHAEYVGSSEEKPGLEVLYLTDVDGVYTSDPNQVSPSQIAPRRIPLIEIDQMGTLFPIWNIQSSNIDDIHTQSLSATIDAGSSQHGHDVTGGLKLKLEAAVEIVQHTGIPVYIVKCGSVDVEHLISGNYTIMSGTLLRRRTRH